MEDLLDPTSFLGILNIVLTIGMVLLPVLLRSRRKAKQKISAVLDDGNFKIANDSKLWPETKAVIVKIDFPKLPILISPQTAREKTPPNALALIALVEFENLVSKQQAAIYIGDREYETGQEVYIKYNPSKPTEAILVFYN